MVFGILLAGIIGGSASHLITGAGRGVLVAPEPPKKEEP